MVKFNLTPNIFCLGPLFSSEVEKGNSSQQLPRPNFSSQCLLWDNFLPVLSVILFAIPNTTD